MGGDNLEARTVKLGTARATCLLSSFLLVVYGRSPCCRRVIKPCFLDSSSLNRFISIWAYNLFKYNQESRWEHALV